MISPRRCGRNALGGSINIVSRKPRLNDFSGYAEYTVDKVDSYAHLDLGVGYTHGDGNVRVEGFVNNVTDEAHASQATIDGGSQEFVFNPPRIFAGIRKPVTAAGGKATLSVDGSFTTRPDVAIVVFGENPYAEWHGNVRSLDYQGDHGADEALLRQLKNSGIHIVAVFLSGGRCGSVRS